MGPHLNQMTWWLGSRQEFQEACHFQVMDLLAQQSTFLAQFICSMARFDVFSLLLKDTQDSGFSIVCISFDSKVGDLSKTTV